MLNNIQLLRAVAAYGVVFFHLSWLNPRLLMPFGNVTVHGVDLFFVISGFIMVHIARRDDPRPGEFMRNRVIRIVPLYWALTVALFALALIGPGLLGARGGDWSGLIRSLLFIGYVNTDGVVQPLVFPGWTLNYEMLFYALFAASLAMRGIAARVGVLSAVLIALMVGGALLDVEDPVARFYTSPRLFEFVLGMVLGLVQPRIRGSVSAGAAAGLAGIGLIVAAELMWGGRWQALAIGPACALIVYAALALEAAGRVVRNRFLLLLGAASYSLYLTHAFVLVPFNVGARGLGLTQGAALAAVVTTALVAVTGVAILVHLGFERPIGERLRGRREQVRALWPWKIGDSGGDKRASEG
jgi:exopolysaccharide production protein ExoZ